MELKKLVTALALVGSAVATSAAYAGSATLDGFAIGGDGSEANPYDIGALPYYPPDTADVIVSLGGTAGSSFEEYLNFTAPVGSTGLGAANPIVLSFGSTLISGLFVEVWDNTHPAGANLIASFSGNNVLHSFSLTAGGQYHLDISGTLTSTQGAYAVALAVANPVPEPETYAMLLAGLGLMGFVARRRQRKLA